ncbi:hypothetical protein QA612_09940 [Evansella sp. AB-P1]|uniref:hypothetical protein n=1 Tax=Evansella sp. AB-P1 TaxID=3037653 RepID=UPI00241D5163|nr:hypothetical protein [Evansella sp. AB-P1]MDG5787819.1 hypothetical protein [Evansella sp. AB-P1]
MTNRKKLYYLVGGIALFALSLSLFFMYTNEPQQESQPIAISETIEPDEETIATDIESINIAEEREENFEATMEDNEEDEEDLREFAEEAIERVTLTPLEAPSEQSFFEHARLDQVLSSLMGSNFTEDIELEDEARWVARDLQAWMQVATETADFSYSDEDFLAFVEEENFLEEDDLKKTVLVNELKRIDDSLYVRHLEYHYLKPFIWNNIESHFSSQSSQNHRETDEEYLYRIFLQFEDEVTNHLLESYPELQENM